MRSLIWVACCAFFALTTALPTIDDYRVKGLEKYGATDELYSGFMPISWEDNKDGSLFFWLAKNRHMKKNEDEKLVVWLNGGPGCSSMIGMMHEHGPFTIETDLDYISSNHTKDSVPIGLKYKLKNNPYSWNEVANILYVEQPIRTGFSVAAKDKALIAGEDQVAIDFRRFLISFMQVFTEYKGVELFIAGESYAGFYVPSIASHILQSQLISTVHGQTTTTVRDKSDGLNLSGVAIGNGVMDMLHQEPSYAEYAYTHGLIPLGAKLKFEKDWENCLEKLKTSKQPLTRGSFDDCNMMGMVLEAAGLPNEYNTATFIQYNEIIGPGSIFDDFFQDPTIQTILHVRGYHLPGINFVPEDADIIVAAAAEEGVTHKSGYYQPAHNWGACSDVVDDAFSADHPISVVPQLQFLSQGSSYTATGHLPGTLDTDTTHTDRRKLRSTTMTTVSTNSNTDSSTTVTSTAATPTTTTTSNTFTSALTALTDAEHSIRVLLYSGEFDLNCNTLGTLHTLEANSWRNKPWAMAERSLWKSGTDTAGEYFTMDGIFSFLIVRNSGHLLPKDLPGTALDLIDRFINSRSFADIPLPSEQSYIDAAYPKNTPGIYPSPTTTTTTLYSSTTIVVGSVFLLLALSVAVWWYTTRDGVSGYLTSKSPNSHNTHAYTKLTQLVAVEEHGPTTPTLDTAMTSTATSAANSRKYGTHEL